MDVTDGCWPVLPESQDPWAFAEHWRDQVQLQAPRWSVTLSGRWPTTDLVVELGHPTVPCVRLRRAHPLHDELGRPAPPEYVVVHIGEQLDTPARPTLRRG